MRAFPSNTKIVPPRLGRHLPRPRVFARIDAAREIPLLWVGAPAGSGKTTLINSYIAHTRRPCLWYRVDAGDADPATVFHHLHLALRHVGKRHRPPLPEFSPEYQHGLDAFTRLFCRGFCASLKPHTVVVLDNYQDATAGASFDRIVAHLVDELPPGVLLVAISRLAAPTSFARFMVNGQAKELNWPDIRFTEEESLAVIRLLDDGETCSDPQVRALYAVTDGWISGLILACDRLKRSAMKIAPTALAPVAATATIPQVVFDYFASEILSTLEEPTQRFLYATAELPQLTVAMAAALTGHRDARKILEYLEQNQMFTTSSGMLPRIYEYHPLFRQFLLRHAEDRYDAAQRRHVQLQAAELATGAGWYESAAAIVIRAGDLARLGALIRRVAPSLVKTGRHDTLQHWLQAFDDQVLAQDAWLSYWRGTSIVRADPRLAYEWYERAFHRFQSERDFNGMYRAWIGVAESLFFNHDDYKPATKWIEELHALRQHARYPSIEIFARVTFSMFNLMTFVCPGHPRFGYWRRRAERLFSVLRDPEAVCLAGFSLARYYGLHVTPARLAAIRDRLAPWVESAKAPPPARILASWVQIWCGRAFGWHEEIHITLDRALIIGRESGAVEYELWLIAGAAYEYIGLGNEPKARELFRMVEQRIRPDRRLELSHFHHLSGDLELFVAHNYPKARGHLVTARELSRAIGLRYLTCLACTSLAQTSIATGDYAAAERELAEADDLARESQLSICRYATDWVSAWLYFSRGEDEQGAVKLAAAVQQIRDVGVELLPMLMASRRMLFYKALELGIDRPTVQRIVRERAIAPPPGESLHPIELRFLGADTITIHGQELTSGRSGRNQPMLFLKLLVAWGGTRISQQRLCDALWPDAESSTAGSSFHTTLHRLRKLVPCGKTVITAENGFVTVNKEQVWVDAWQLEHELDALEIAIAGDNLAVAGGHFTVAQRLYQGPFAEQDVDAAWAHAYREKLRNRIVRVSTNLGRAFEHRHHLAAATSAYKYGLELDPANELLYHALMNALILDQRAAEAAAIYRRCRAHFARALGTMPSASTTALYRKAMEEAGASINQRPLGGAPE